MGYFAVIDTETNWSDQVMSIGVVIADTINMEAIDTKYYILTPEYKEGGMFSDSLGGVENQIITTRSKCINELKDFLKRYNVNRLLAYNAHFDKNHLPELRNYEWCDIIKFAAYKQYNKKIPASCPCWSTGRMKAGYGVEEIMKILGCEINYFETHNALIDALDELTIVKKLQINYQEYYKTII